MEMPGSNPLRLGAPRRGCTRGPWGGGKEVLRSPSVRAVSRHCEVRRITANGALYVETHSNAPPVCLFANRSPRPSLGHGLWCPQRAQSLCYLGAAGFFERSGIASIH